MARRSSSLNYIDSGISREIESQFDDVRKVANHIDSVVTVATQDLAALTQSLQQATDFEGITVIQGVVAGWDPVTKVLTIPTVKGDKGDTGLKGDTGATGVIGARGPQGLQGLKGDVGPTGPMGPAGANGSKGDKGDKGDTGADLTIEQIIYNNNGTFTWHFSDESTYTTPDLRGPKGDTGSKGDRGLQGVSVHHIKPTSTTNIHGEFGTPNNTDIYTMYGDSAETIVLGYFPVRNGESVYQFAADKGFIGTEEGLYLGLTRVNEAIDAADVAVAAKISSETSANAAANSATNSATSAAQAVISQTSSLTSANNAADSAAASLTSRNQAEGFASTALSQAGVATTKAAEAVVSATTATTQAGIAATEAATATTQAGIATTKANEASTSATASATSAGNALSSAQAASMSETNAGISETNAAASALSASTSATQASTSEANALQHKNNAEIAATTAIAAKDTAVSVEQFVNTTYLGSSSTDPAVDNNGDPLVTGSFYFNTVQNRLKIYNGTVWNTAVFDTTGVVLSFNGREGSVVLTNADVTNAVGVDLSSVEYGATADQTKADIDALNINADTLDGQHGSYYTGYTDTAIANLVGSSPETLDTLNELAAALGNDPNFATTVSTQIGTKVDKIVGKGLSTEDYTTSEKSKLAGIESGATGDQIASEVPVTASGNLTSTNVQLALEELQVDIDSLTTTVTDNDLAVRAFAVSMAIALG